jgi:ribosomal biogenesis protein LAS1
LLTQLQPHHPYLPSTLANRIVAHLLSDTPQAGISVDHDDHWPDESFDMCLARWAWWTVDTWSIEDDEDEESDLKKDVILTLITSLGPESNHKPGDKKAYVSLSFFFFSAFGNFDSPGHLHAAQRRSSTPFAPEIQIWKRR